MFIPTINVLSKDEFQKAFELGKRLYELENVHIPLIVTRRVRIARIKNKLIEALEGYGVSVDDKSLSDSKDTILHTLEDYDLSSTNVAWTGYFVYGILVDMKKNIDNKDTWLRLISQNFFNPGYASMFYSDVYDMYSNSSEPFIGLIKKSYYDTYGIVFDEV